MLLNTVDMWRYALDKILIFGGGWAQSVLESRNPLNWPLMKCLIEKKGFNMIGKLNEFF